ncbi:MAG: glycosyltransferase family 4 protein [Pseudomonas sp.]|nr:glycosyltransferase family 4 protein [Pseudomonas sp.]
MTKKIDKVLFVSTLYYPNKGGIENSIKEISKVLIDKGVECHLVCSDRNNLDGQVLDKNETIDGLIIHRYAYGSGFLSLFIQFFNAFVLLYKLNRNNYFKLVVVRSFLPVLSARLAGFSDIKYLVPSVVYFQNKASSSLKFSFLVKIKNKVDIFLQFFAYLFSDVYVFAKPVQEQVRISSLGIVKPKILNPGVNSKRFKIASSFDRNKIKIELGLPIDKKIILCLGRFAELKQFDLVIKAMEDISEEYYLVVVGEGPEKEKYIEIANSSRAVNRIKIFPATDKPESFFKVSNIFMMTSYYETFGQVLLEATASGAKVFAFSRKTGVDTAVEDIYSGFDNLVKYVDDQSVQGLVEAVNDFEFDLGDDFYSEIDMFIHNYSWGKLVSDLVSSK